MTTDLYAKCPCGSGKKIKFCCKDIISDIERIERMLRGEQRTAALDKINKLLEKHPDRAALLCLKAQVHLELQSLDEVTPTIDRLLEVEPENPSALAMKATTIVLSGELSQGLALLHHALRASDGVLSKMVYRSYVAICVHLIQQEEFIAAYAHVLTMVSITKGEERTCVSMLMNLTSSEKLPAIFQGLLISDVCPPDVTWKREFEVALEHYRHGDWSTCAAMLNDMSKRILDEPVIVRNKAILQSWICQRHAAIKSFREFAAIRNVDRHDAVEAEACAQVLEPTDLSDTVELVAVAQEVDDADAVMEKLLSADWVKSVPVQPVSDSDGPPAKGQFLVYDRPRSEAEEVTLPLDDIPREIASCTLRGKETDQAARLILLLYKDDLFSSTIDRIGALVGKSFESDQEELVGNVHKIERMFRPNLSIPGQATLEQHQQIQQEYIHRQLSDAWPKLSLSAFGGKSAREASTDRKLQTAVLGSILNLEMWMDRQPVEFDFNQLRVDLGLPAVESISGEGVDVRSLSPGKLLALEIESLADADVKTLFDFLSVRPNGKLLYRLGTQILARASMANEVDLIEVHERMANLAPTTDETLAHLGQARDIAVSEGESPAAWLISELDVRIQRDEVDAVKQLMTEIQTRYIREPGVANMLGAVLNKYGLMPSLPHGAAAPDTLGEVPVAAAAPSGGIWTPDSDGPSPTSAETGEGESKLWVPGMD